MTRKHPNSWRALNRRLNTMTESELEQELQAELAGARRVTVLERLHQRLCAKRGARERIEILKEAAR